VPLPDFWIKTNGLVALVAFPKPHPGGLERAEQAAVDLGDHPDRRKNWGNKFPGFSPTLGVVFPSCSVSKRQIVYQRPTPSPLIYRVFGEFRGRQKVAASPWGRFGREIAPGPIRRRSRITLPPSTAAPWPQPRTSCSVDGHVEYFGRDVGKKRPSRFGQLAFSIHGVTGQREQVHFGEHRRASGGAVSAIARDPN
jgi:hypothetical protein